VIGRSLGSGVATYVASKKEVNKLVLITPFDSILNVAQEQYPLYPLMFLLKDTYDSKSRVSLIKAQSLIIVAKHDKIVSKARSDALIKAFEPSQLEVKIINKGHINLISDKKYNKVIKHFMSDK
jgi:esterase/lipase